MKPQFEKDADRDYWLSWCALKGYDFARWYTRGGRYTHRYSNYFRNPNTHSERRRNTADVLDYGQRIVRGRRRNLPSSYDDLNVARSYGRSWKDYTKQRHQWKDS